MINENEEEFGKLHKFSAGLIKLGKEIEEKFREKKLLEQDVAQKEKEAGALRSEIFRLREKLIKLNLELVKLEQRRRQLAGGVE